MGEPTRLERALECAERGWAVFPLHTVWDKVCSCGSRNCASPGKHPRVKNGVHDATKDPKVITDWWTQWPSANIGIATGKISGILLLDVDNKEGIYGDDNLAILEGEYGELPPTVTALTGGGGRHIFFAYPDGDLEIPNSAGKLYAGLDVKSDGGYVVGAGSQHVDGPYLWEVSSHPDDVKVADLPAWLLRLMLEHGRDRRKKEPIRPPEGDSLQAGKRNTYLAQVCGSLNYQGISQEVIKTIVRETNLRVCDPPLSDHELERTVFTSLRSWEPVPWPKAHYTDVGNAQRFAMRHGHVTRWVEVGRKKKSSGYWMIWDGARWFQVAVGIDHYAKETVMAMYKECAEIADSDTRAKLRRHAAASESSHRIEAMLRLARSEPDMAVDVNQLDQHPWLLNFENGTLDLRTGQLLEPDPKLLMTKTVPFPYDPDADCPRWLQFVDEIMAGNDDLVNFLQRVLGYSLTGRVEEHAWFILYGTGRNGKTTFLETVKHCLGDDYAQQAPLDILKHRAPGNIPSDLARLRGARFAAVAEPKLRMRINTAVVKHITGGDKIVARFMHHDWFEFPPTHKLFVGTNYKPIIEETTDAIWHRTHLVPFTQKFVDETDDKELGDKLKIEAMGIMAWMVEGCLAWQREGLNRPEEVKVATDQYRAEMDLLGEFLEERCHIGDGLTARAGALYNEYKSWCDEVGQKPLSGNNFGQALLEKGFEKLADRKGRCYIGLGLLNHHEAQSTLTM